MGLNPEPSQVIVWLQWQPEQGGEGQEARRNAGIQRLKSLDCCYKHAGMKSIWDIARPESRCV